VSNVRKLGRTSTEPENWESNAPIQLNDLIPDIGETVEHAIEVFKELKASVNLKKSIGSKLTESKAKWKAVVSQIKEIKQIYEEAAQKVKDMADNLKVTVDLPNLDFSDLGPDFD